MRVQKRRGVIEITIKQIVGIFFAYIIVLTAVFYIGVYIGKRKVINAEIEAQKQYEQTVLAKIKDVVNSESKITLKKDNPQIKYTIKIGTFSSNENAKKMLNLLKTLGYKPEIKTEGELYHVIIGSFDNIESAKDFGDSLIKKIPDLEKYIIKTY